MMGNWQQWRAIAGSILCFAAANTAQAWQPGVGNESNTSGFTVDTSSRNDVISFWHCVYMESEGYEGRINWTGSISSGNAGTTSAAFKGDVERRINFFRAMAGLPANINVTSSSAVVLSGSTPANAKPSASTTKEAAAQAAAFMLSDNSSEYLPGGGVASGTDNPHSPPNDWSSDNATARNGAYHSNLAVGTHGPSAIDAYIDEDDPAAAGAENNDVGHRRYIFYSRIQEMATGDVPPTTSPSSFSANALYITGNLLPAQTPKFVPWPNAGYFPRPLLPTRWSLTYPEADFSSASVSVSGPSGTVGTTIVSTANNFGDNTIIWKLNSAVPNTDLADQSYSVTISNIIIDGSAQSYSYEVTIINPDRLIDPTNLSGSLSPPDTGANYFFDTVPHAEAYEMEVSSQVPATWLEGAEDGTDANIIDNTDVAYDLRDAITYNSQQFWDTDSKAFRLAFPRNEFNAFQSFQIDRTLIPLPGAKIKFRFRRGFMAANTRFEVQSSVNGGTTWSTLQSYSGTNTYDNSFSTQIISLASTGQNTIIRFILHQPANTGVFSVDAYPSIAIGAFVDGIEPVSCEVLQAQTPVSYPSSAEFVTLDSTSAGSALTAGNSYVLRLRAKVGCKWFSYGDNLEVTPVSAASLSSYQKWLRESYAIIGNYDEDYDNDGTANGLEFIFDLNPMDSTDAVSLTAPSLTSGNLILSHPIRNGETVEAEYSETLESGSWLPATVTISGGTATATAPASVNRTFIRWKHAQP